MLRRYKEEGAFGETWEIDEEFVENETQSATWFIAEASDDRFLGLVGVIGIPSVIGPVALLNSMYVTPAERAGALVLKELVAAAERWASEHGLRSILCSTRYRTSTGVAKRLGWTPVGVDFVKEL